MADTLRALIEARDLNQREFADLVGTTPRTISRIVQGHNNPSYPLAMRMAVVLHVTAEQVFQVTVARRTWGS